MKALLFKLRNHLQNLLLQPDALILLSFLGVITGLLSGALIILFRWVIDNAQLGFLDEVEQFETLAAWLRFFLPILGGLFIGISFELLVRNRYVVGVVLVLERLAYHHGRLGVRGLILQFFGAAAAIISGHSVGREGPSVHLGAASGSLLSQSLGLPNNSSRILVGSGVAAAIAASFNTPLAGVIFALEVIMLDYAMISFIPIILASVSATALSVLVYGSEPAFQIPPLELADIAELPLVILLGIIIGIVSAAFIQLIVRTARYSRKTPFWIRTTLAGFVVGSIAYFYPQVMGVGYDSVEQMLLGHMGLTLLLGIIVAKLFATSASLGLGIPGGVIGPTLFIGAALGAAYGIMLQQINAGASSDAAVYALIGMGAMMGATLQAPLAALTAILELTYNPAIVLPAMLAIVTAGLTASEIFKQSSVFLALLRARGLDYRHDPVIQKLLSTSVVSLMAQNLSEIDSEPESPQLIDTDIEWQILRDPDNPDRVTIYQILADSLEQNYAEVLRLEDHIPGIHRQASLLEALEQMDALQVDYLFVEQTIAPGLKRIEGLISRELIENQMRYKRRTN